jgi:hypothetical protein
VFGANSKSNHIEEPKFALKEVADACGIAVSPHVGRLARSVPARQVPTLKLTRAAVERIRAPDPSGKQVIHWDADLKGFGLLVSGTTDSKSFIAQRRLPDGRSRRVTVGAVGEFARVDALPNRIAGDYLKLLLFTGMRRREAAALRWDEVDFGLRVSSPSDRRRTSKSRT